ncbi:MAG: inositol monophosphatase family protein [Flavobacteriales bacterium]|nr:inositol monophosphatase family protein [Flavobacteriales bacterium]
MNAHELKKIEEQVIALSRHIGDWMKQQRVDESTADLKTPNNLVTSIDRESERMFVEGLSRILPQAGIIAEEGSGIEKSGLNWVIDPLDGTTNFVHSVPVWCTSIGLCDDNHPIMGVIYDPNFNECFAAYQDGGARLNGKTIQVSTIATLAQSLLATGFPYDDFGREVQYIKVFHSLMHTTRGMRRLGSAALDMAWVACGRFEAFYEYGLSPWDVAAGTIIVREAGGIVTGFGNGPNPVFGEDIISSNGKIHAALDETVGSFFKE